jgi:5-carboxymethyl-2-hydroxymuconate isomerase
MPDNLARELSELVRQARQEGDEEKLLALTKRINELLHKQEQKQNRVRQNDAA